MVDVALQRTVYTAAEGDSTVEICAVVNTSTIAFDFKIDVTIKYDSDENPFLGLCSAILKVLLFAPFYYRYIFNVREPVIFFF